MKKYYLIYLSLLISFSTLAQPEFPLNLVEQSIVDLESPITMKVNRLKPGEAQTLLYEEHNVFVYRRTKKDMDYLFKVSTDSQVREDSIRWKESTNYWRETSLSRVSNYVFKNSQKEFDNLKFRSIKDGFFIAIGMDPKYKCNVKFLDSSLRKMLKAPDLAVFWHVCHGQFFDSAGREISKNGVMVDEGKNLLIPPHKFESESKLIIGDIVFPRDVLKKPINYSNLSIQKTLWKACHNNDYKTVVMAIRKGADLNLLEDRGNALDYAIGSSSLSIVKLLLKEGAKPTKISKNMAEIMSRNDVLDILLDIENNK